MPHILFLLLISSSNIILQVESWKCCWPCQKAFFRCVHGDWDAIFHSLQTSKLVSFSYSYFFPLSFLLCFSLWRMGKKDKPSVSGAIYLLYLYLFLVCLFSSESHLPGTSCNSQSDMLWKCTQISICICHFSVLVIISRMKW